MTTLDERTYGAILTMANRRLHLLSNSEEKVHRACVRKHHFAYRLMVRPIVKPKPLRFGTLGHYGLEKWWHTGGDVRAAIEYVRSKRTPETDEYELVDVECLLLGYHTRWIDEPYQALAVEVKFDAPLVHPGTGQVAQTFRHVGRIDAIARHLVMNETHLIEHKFSSEDIALGSDYWRRLRLDSQVSKYFMGADALGYKIDRCLYDVVRRVDLEPKKATPVERRQYTKPTKKDPEPRLYANQRETDETTEEYRARVIASIGEKPDHYFSRGFVMRLDADMREWAMDSWKRAEAIARGERDGHYPRNPDACMLYGRSCEYLPVCAGEASLDDETRYRRSLTPHEELVEESTT